MALSPDYLSKLEYGTRSLAAAALDIREALRSALNISRSDWTAATGLATEHDPDQSARDLVKMGAEPINGRYPVPVLGDVAAGGRNDTFVSIEEAEEEIDVGYDLARRYGLSNLYGLRVNGDSMYSERVRFSVPNGSTLIVHREMQPTRGDLVIAYIEDLDLGVVKEYGEPEDVALSSYNPRGPIYRANEHRIRICGVVVEVRFRPHVRPMH
ncbi:LexA family protein [Deinococcus enclensis]|uniref:SOS-response transcriptional repressor LexA n=1 Tax=Deinococcus enclensis TaxID=1049582 RepID=A0ABT9MEC0_9DEIO|nr:S24 family peptidase [Deinococcus enclensis]MDP9764910.1 SOS-response transcriptional repressor LexA [Deinococcus enclensis]